MTAVRSMGVLTFTHPRSSSDYCLMAASHDPACPARVLAACDMVGRPGVLYWGNYMRRVERDLQTMLDAEYPADLDALTALVRRVIRHHNALVRAIRQRHDRTAFGFCLVLAAVWGDVARVHWLGDCRAYRIRGTAAQCLTRDQNRLMRTVEEAQDHPLTLFISEMAELSHRLEGFLGMDDDTAMDALLDAQDVRVRLDGETALLLATDGLFMPLIRQRMDATYHRITPAELLAESEIGRILAEADEAPAETLAVRWRHRAEHLAANAVRGGWRHRRYRDDIAFILLHPSDEPMEGKS